MYRHRYVILHQLAKIRSNDRRRSYDVISNFQNCANIVLSVLRGLGLVTASV